MEVLQESSTASMELEQEQEKQAETSNNMSVDWLEDVDLEFSVGEDPTDTGSTSSEERENSPENMKEHSRKTAENANGNTNEQEVIYNENSENLEQATTGISLVNQANKVLQEEARRRNWYKNVAQRLQKAEKIEVIVETDIGSKQIVDNEEFIQVTSKRNKKKM
ncbi:33090_t:CDS:2, partial [Gigaspora margarita]